MDFFDHGMKHAIKIRIELSEQYRLKCYFSSYIYTDVLRLTCCNLNRTQITNVSVENALI